MQKAWSGPTELSAPRWIDLMWVRLTGAEQALRPFRGKFTLSQCRNSAEAYVSIATCYVPVLACDEPPKRSKSHHFGLTGQKVSSIRLLSFSTLFEVKFPALFDVLALKNGARSNTGIDIARWVRPKDCSRSLPDGAAKDSGNQPRLNIIYT